MFIIDLLTMKLLILDNGETSTTVPYVSVYEIVVLLTM